MECSPAGICPRTCATSTSLRMLSTEQDLEGASSHCASTCVLKCARTMRSSHRPGALWPVLCEPGSDEYEQGQRAYLRLTLLALLRSKISRGCIAVTPGAQLRCGPSETTRGHVWQDLPPDGAHADAISRVDMRVSTFHPRGCAAGCEHCCMSLETHMSRMRANASHCVRCESPMQA
jgi:hypothetical protein